MVEIINHSSTLTKLVIKVFIMTSNQKVGFIDALATYDERGYSEKPLLISRRGDTSQALVVNVFLSETLNEKAPSAQSPVYENAIEIFWKAGDDQVKEIPIRIKAGSVQSRPLLLEAHIEVPASSPCEIEKGYGHCAFRIHNEYTSPYGDRTEFILPKRVKELQNASSPSLSLNTPTYMQKGEILTPFLPPQE